MPPPKILYIVSHWSGAPTYGAQHRVQQIGRLLKQIGCVNMVVLNGDGQDERWRTTTEAEFNIARVITVQAEASNGILGRLRHEFDPRYLYTSPAAVTAGERQAVLDLSSKHDVTWLHTIKTANTLGIYRWPNSVLDIDDIPSRFYQSMADEGSNYLRRLLNYRMSFIWRRRERMLTNRFNVLMVCSENDRRYLGAGRARILPNGFPPLPNVERRPSQPPRIGFIGTFRWEPNVTGMRWFCDHAWPRVKANVPEARLRVVGEGTNVATGWGEHIDGVGRIDDAAAEIATWSAMIVPVRTGGGTRIKVLEGFARKCPVVSTHMGAFGHDVQDGEEIFLADEPEIFASRCVTLIQSPESAENIIERAYNRLMKCWTWESYEGRVREAVELALER